MFHRSAFAAVLVLSMAGVAAVRRAPKDNPAFRQKLPKDEQALQALDRLTYGPRPGDVAEVERIGLKKWIASQLHPEKIRENPELQTKLATLPSLNMSTAELVERYPPPQLIRQMAEGKAPLPADPIARMAAQNLMARYQQEKSAKDKAGGGDMSDDAQDAREKLLGALTEDQIRTLRRGTPEAKKTLLASLAPGRLEYVAVALPRGLRQQLICRPSGGAPDALADECAAAGGDRRSDRRQAVPRHLQQPPARRRAGRFLVQPFQRFLDKGADRFEVPEYERNAIRPHVLGKFRDLLEAPRKARPCFSIWTTGNRCGAESVAANDKNPKNRRGLNENYGRELMELHTLGVDGGYTQKDVTEVARCFTGWTIRDPRKGGGFFYNDQCTTRARRWCWAHAFPAGGGIEDGEKVLDILARHPSTAHFIFEELAQKFVADNPPQALVDRMAQTFLKTDGDIREVMKTMLDSQEFWSEGAYRAKVKTPFEMVVSAVRALDAKVDDVCALADQVGKLGEPLYRKLEPTGYSNVNAEWVNSAALLGRMNFALQLAQNKLPGVKLTSSALRNAAWMPLVPRPRPQTSAAIDKAPDEAAGWRWSSPEFQRR